MKPLTGGPPLNDGTVLEVHAYFAMFQGASRATLKVIICFTLPKDLTQVHLREGTASHLLFRPMKTSIHSTTEVV